MKQCTLIRNLPRPRLLARRYDRTHAYSDDAPRRGRIPTLEAADRARRQDESDGVIKVDAESKTVETAAGTLPLSPVMNPDWIEAVQRHTKPKEKAKAQPTGRFRKLLAKNIYAQALAQPVRACALTSARLPQYFLQQFRPVLNPTTQTAWWMPSELAPKTRTSSSDVPLQNNSTLNVVEGRRGPTSYVLAQERIVGRSQEKASRRAGISVRLMGSRSWNIQKLPGKRPAVWREGMDGAVLGMMRDEVVADLLELAKAVEEEGKLYLVPLKEWGDAEPVKMKGCILWWEEEPTVQNGEGAERRDGGSVSPKPYATLDVQGVYGSKIPVHNLHSILGEAHLDRLRQGSAIFRDNTMAVVARVKTTPTQKKLWKLQGYVAGGGAVQ